MKNRWIVLGAALLAGMLAAVTMGLYLTGTRQKLEAGMEPVPVLVAVEGIPKGVSVADLVKGDKLELRKVARRDTVDGAIDSLKGLEDRVLGTSLVKGDQLSVKRLQEPGDAGLSYTLGKGEIAVAVPVNDYRKVADLVKPGDLVAVFGSIMTDPPDEGSWVSGVLFPRVKVLAVDAVTEKAASAGADKAAEGQPGQSQPIDQYDASVTVAVPPAEAPRLILAIERGRVWFGLHPSADAPAFKAEKRSPGGLF